MESTIEYCETVYTESARNLDLIKLQYHSLTDPYEKKEFFKIKYMVILIYNDLCREYLNLQKNSSEGTSKVLALGPIILKLYEARHWFKGEGNKKLLELASNRGIKSEVEKKLKELKNIKSSRIQLYSNYRNKFAGHYSFESLIYLEELERENEETFFSDVETVILYFNKWLNILSYVGNPEAA